MIAVAYQRWGLFRSKLTFFAEDLPATDGYHFVICEQCFSKLPPHPLFIPKEFHTIIVDLTKDPDMMLKQMNKRRRQIIKSGLKMGYQIEKKPATMEGLRELKQLWNKMIVPKGGTPLVSLNYFKAMLPYMTIFKGIYEGQTLMISSVINDDRIVRGFFQARDETIKGKPLDYVGSVLQWEIMTDFNHRGYQFLDVGSANQRLLHYKLSFGGERVPQYSYDVPLTPLARLLLNTKRKIELNFRKIYHRNTDLR